MHILHMHRMHIFSLNRTAIPEEINVQNLSLYHLRPICYDIFPLKINSLIFQTNYYYFLIQM